MEYIMGFTVLDGTNGKNNVEVTIETLAGETSDWYILPPGIADINVALIIEGGGGGKVQSSNDIQGMRNDTAIPIDWDFGEVSVSKAGITKGVRGLRVVNTSGTVTLFVVGAFA